MILHTLQRIGKEETYPLLIKTMFDKEKALAHLSRAMVVKSGEKILPFVMKAMPKYPQYKDLFLKLIMKISPRAAEILSTSTVDDPQLKFYVNQLQARLAQLK